MGQCGTGIRCRPTQTFRFSHTDGTAEFCRAAAHLGTEATLGEDSLRYRDAGRTGLCRRDRTEYPPGGLRSCRPTVDQGAPCTELVRDETDSRVETPGVRRACAVSSPPAPHRDRELLVTMYLCHVVSDRSPSAMYRHPSQGSYNLNPYNYATAHPAAYPAEYGQYQRPEEWDGRGYNCSAGTGLTAGPTGSCTAFPGMDYPVPVGAIQANSPAVSGVTTNSTNSQRPQHSRNPYDWMRKSNYSTSPPPVLSVRGMPPQGRKDGGRCEILGPDGKTRTKDKYRVVYSDHQRLELEKEFYSNKYITIKRKVQLANELGLSERQVKIWFQNRRAKQRKMAKRKELQHGGQGGSDDGGGVMGEVSALTQPPSPPVLIPSHDQRHDACSNVAVVRPFLVTLPVPE
ncbi:homeobox [Branchiostoma belcheri]|nr:homeobox [Branchiostoma belcheri]